jgi:hypothetical protein
MENLAHGAKRRFGAQVSTPPAFQFDDAARAVCNDGAGVESTEAVGS